MKISLPKKKSDASELPEVVAGEGNGKALSAKHATEHETGEFQKRILAFVDGSLGANGNIVEVVDGIFRYALEQNASDIHIEPTHNGGFVRLRLDGTLQNILSLPKTVFQAVIGRLKILANMKTDESRRPQDARIGLEHLNIMNTSLRISTIPTIYGEKAVLRVIGDKHRKMSLSELGFSREHEATLLRNIEKPFGLIVSSGPTGSGKTTTLYQLLGFLKKDGINISTLEDPVESAIEGVNQIQIDPRIGFTFASGLRSLLRQDPDIIMVGEIRDSETAVMASNAALTGHLVFTTLHTNDAPSAIPRLLEMRVEDFVVGSIVNVIIGQRLVRTVCDACKKKEKLSAATLAKIEKRKDVLDLLPAFKSSPADIHKRTFYRGVGCDACVHTGYAGRIGIFEILELTSEIHRLTLEHAPAEEIKKVAVTEGFRDMVTDGLEKVFNGVTTFDELLRTTRNI